MRVESEVVGRDDGPGWMAERFRLRYFIQEKEVDRREFLGFEEMRDSGWLGRVSGFFQKAKRGACSIWRS